MLRWECIHESISRQGDVRQIRVTIGVHSQHESKSRHGDVRQIRVTIGVRSQHESKPRQGDVRQISVTMGVHSQHESKSLKETRRSADSCYDDGSDDLCYNGSAFTTH